VLFVHDDADIDQFGGLLSGAHYLLGMLFTAVGHACCHCLLSHLELGLKLYHDLDWKAVRKSSYQTKNIGGVNGMMPNFSRSQNLCPEDFISKQLPPRHAQGQCLNVKVMCLLKAFANDHFIRSVHV